MAYTTQQHLEERFGEKMLRDLTDRGTPPAGAVNAAVVARALADTDAMIDGHLAGRYALPMVQVPPLVADIAIAIAIYKLHLQLPSDKIVRDYDQALRSLRDIAAGSVKLPVAGMEAAEKSTGPSIMTNDPYRPLRNGPMGGLI